MTEHQTASEIKALLERYEGVSIENILHAKNKIAITARITDAASIVRIAHAIAGANAGSSLYEIGLPVDGEPSSESLARLRFQYSLGTEDDNPKSEWFGLFLVWDLAKREILERKEADRLLKLWNGAARSKK